MLRSVDNKICIHMYMNMSYRIDSLKHSNEVKGDPIDVNSLDWNSKHLISSHHITFK
jgi:hypothetical protein